MPRLPEPYELSLKQIERLIEASRGMIGGTICWELYHAAKSKGLSPQDAYNLMIEQKKLLERRGEL